MKRNFLLAGVLSLFSISSMAWPVHKDWDQSPQAPMQPQPVESNTPNSHVYTQGSTVTTSPLLGIRSSFDASDLIVNMPTMNEDLRFLQQRQQLKHDLHCSQLPNADRPIVEISGDVVGQVYYQDPYAGHSTHNVDLTGARLDFLAEISHWVLGYISIDYDNSKLDSILTGAGSRIANSRIYLKRGFLTIGDLDISPVYFSLGQMFVPFGRYASFIVSSPLTVALAQTNNRVILLGAASQGFYGSAYAFKGDSDVGSTGINQWGVNGGYIYQADDVSVEVGAGYMGNIADSAGMQLTNNSSGFAGFGFDSATEMLHRRVPAFDVHGELNYQNLSLSAEYIGTTRAFDAMDLMYNYDGAQPTALHTEASYKFNILCKPSRITLAYGHSSEALALGLPRDSFIGAFSISVWKNTIESIEYRHDRNYSDSDVSGGSGATPAVVQSVGGSSNSVLGQIGVYF